MADGENTDQEVYRSSIDSGKHVAFQDPAVTGELLVPLKDPTRSNSKYILAGQRGINPCICCACCCKGTCTLKRGCFLIGILHIFVGLLLLAVSLAILFGPKPQKKSKPDVEPDPTDADFWFMEAFMRVDAILMRDMIINILSLVTSCVFSIPPGIIIIIACVRTEKILAVVYSGIMVGAIIFQPVQAVLCTMALNAIKMKDVFPEKANKFHMLKWEDFQLGIVITWWTVSAIVISLETYFGLCGLFFYKQIKEGQYEYRGMPPPLPVLPSTEDEPPPST